MIFHLGDCVYAVVYVEQWTVVIVEIRARRRMQARGAQAFDAEIAVFAPHGVHVGRRTSEIAYIAFEIRHVCDSPNFAEY